ncbi:MAG: hypothetical protein N2749_06960 [Clostridia bacterium]|nr:hypothetical protein [Clostridia bacterium]
MSKLKVENKVKKESKVNNSKVNNVNNKTEKIQGKNKFLKVIAIIFSFLLLIVKNIVKFIKKYPVIVIIAIVAVIVAIVATIVFNYYYDKQYKSYELKIHNYGFDKMYNNGQAKGSQKVTKSEAIKIILSSIYNTSDISGLEYYEEPEKDNYPNRIWVTYALNHGIIKQNEITKENENQKVKYIEMLKYYLDARSKLMDKPVSANEASNFSDLKKYTSDDQNYINDAVSNGLIEQNNGKINAKSTLTKGRFNQIIIKFVEVYNTITVGGEKININPQKFPKNADIYPYTLANIDKSIYEIPNYISDFPNVQTPLNVYMQRKEVYSQIKDHIEGYLNTILNVDYTNISFLDFRSKLEPYCMYAVNQDSDVEYVNYVISNKIKLSGKATVQMPILYYDGTDFRIRTKIEFKVDSADTKENLIYGDNTNETVVKYTKNEYSMYIDVPISFTVGGSSFYVYNAFTMAENVSGSIFKRAEM